MGLKKSFTAVLIALFCNTLWAQTIDSVDVLDYDISLDLSAGAPFKGEATIRLRLERPCASIALQLVGTVDSVELAGQRIASPTLAALPTAGIAAGQEFDIRVWYTGRNYVESYGFGGFHFDNDMSYNLGVGFNTDPHTLGRAMFPCRDNFTDKATYTLRVKTRAGWSAECGGTLVQRTTTDDGCEQSVWRIAQPTPTYLVSVSQAPFTRIHDSIPSLHGTYPLTLGYLNRDSTLVREAFACLDSVVPMFERRFGPYRWGRIGYIATRKGSMEHVNNIALDRAFITSTAERAQSTIAHELGHAWFGNLITCETEGDMWINEGGASFTSEVAMEAVLGRKASDDYYQRNLEAVIRRTHITDGTYRPLSPMPHQYTYGSTTYDKGWMVWHSLRGYMGEQRFYNALQRLMASCAFSNIDAYRLRDSLGYYSGIDLTDFFDFHVFGTGFMDYHVSLLAADGACNANDANITIRQQALGNGTPMRSAHVPVTFFSAEGDTAKRWVDFEEESIDAVFRLPFAAAYCVLDYDLELSDAATLGEAHLPGNGVTQRMPTAHIQVRSDAPADIYAEHHWGTPHGTMPHSVVRTARRYWMLRGNWTADAAVHAMFRYVRHGYQQSEYASLDQNFLRLTASCDSLALLYRASANEKWRPISTTRSSSSNSNEGFLTADSLLPGEYTLAVVDTARLGIVRPGTTSAEANMFPNPLAPGQPLTVDMPTSEPFSIAIFDAEGRLAWRKEGCTNGQKLWPSLAKGTYFVLIENNFLSLHSKLIAL